MPPSGTSSRSRGVAVIAGQQNQDHSLVSGQGIQTNLAGNLPGWTAPPRSKPYAECFERIWAASRPLDLKDDQ